MGSSDRFDNLFFVLYSSRRILHPSSGAPLQSAENLLLYYIVYVTIYIYIYYYTILLPKAAKTIDQICHTATRRRRCARRRCPNFWAVCYGRHPAKRGPRQRRPTFAMASCRPDLSYCDINYYIKIYKLNLLQRRRLRMEKRPASQSHSGSVICEGCARQKSWTGYQNAVHHLMLRHQSKQKVGWFRNCWSPIG